MKKLNNIYIAKMYLNVNDKAFQTGNIIINASQAMPEGGKIIISAENSFVKASSAIPLKDGKYPGRSL